MRKIVIGGMAAVLGVTTAVAGGAFAGGNGAQKSGLSPRLGDNNSQCYAGSGAGTNGFAIAALVFGIVPVCFIGIVFGIIALVQTSKTGQKGKGFAITGLVLSGVWLIGLVTLGVVASQDTADRDSSGKVTKEGKVFAEDLKVGDCFNGLNDVQVGDNIGTVRAIPCGKLHEAEAFAHVHLEGSSYPGSKTLQAQEQGQPCIDKLKTVAPEASGPP